MMHIIGECAAVVPCLCGRTVKEEWRVADDGGDLCLRYGNAR